MDYFSYCLDFVKNVVLADSVLCSVGVGEDSAGSISFCGQFQKPFPDLCNFRSTVVEISMRSWEGPGFDSCRGTRKSSL